MKCLLLGFLLVSSSVPFGLVFSVPPAFACDGAVAKATQPTAQKVLFYRATHESYRCAWQWGDSDTTINTEEMSLADASALFEKEKRAASSKKYFEDYGSWFIYYDSGLWYAVGFYRNGEKPFVKPTTR
jgi:hypothetical protein